VVTEDVAKKAGVGFYSTYGWHPLSVAAALANLGFWGRHNSQILANVSDQYSVDCRRNHFLRERRGFRR